MKVIVGLGNPGRRYERTRHNVGWWVVDHLADVWHLGKWREDGHALAVSGRLGATHVRLLKPLTYMNLSGEALIPFLRRPGWSAAKDLLVIVDDVALPVGTIRLRLTGSSGGHNGLKSVEAQVGSKDYARLRVGIRPENEEWMRGPLEEFVLGPFGVTEREKVTALFPRITEVVEGWVRTAVDGSRPKSTEVD